MQISLAKRGPAMWFLGEPRNIRVSLNSITPGPVDIDFTSLTEVEQKKVLQGISAGAIESDVDYQTLYEQHLEEGAEDSKPIHEDPVIQAQIEAREQIELKRQRLQEAKEKKDRLYERRSQKIASSSATAIRSRMYKEKDLRLLKMVLEAEKVGKGRVGTIAFLAEKVKKETIEQEKKLSKKIKNKIAKRDREFPKETNGLHVVESEEDTVILNSADLIQIASRKL